MQLSRQFRTGLVIVAVVTAVLCARAPGQDPPAKEPPAKDPSVHEAKGIPPRAAPADYQAHAEAGAVTLAAESAGHSVPTPEALLTTDDYVVIEVGVFGPPQARAALSYRDFTLSIDGRKPVPAQAYTLVFRSIKDPSWEPTAAAKKASTSIGTGGKQDDGPPAPVHMPLDMERAMLLRVQKAAFPEGEHAFPEAGFLFFKYGGKIEHIHSMELTYSGSTGQATLLLRP